MNGESIESDSGERSRQFVIGDLHGQLGALETMLDIISPTEQDQVIFLGDFIDRGQRSNEVIQRILELGKRTKVIALRGNHMK